MCGIFGLLDMGRRALPVGPTTESLERGIAAIRHRGPDAQDIRIDGSCGLAHARLSIVDLAGGAQPMSIHDGALTVTFNGEIFNHVELRAELAALGHQPRTRSDTEVILHAYAQWGERCVDHFNGQWAFALWDHKHQRLFCARDRVGVRPFFWAQREGLFSFASEIKALFATGVPRTLDVHGLHEVLTFWCTRAPRTVWQGVQELPPGHVLVVEAGQIHVRQAWQLSFHETRTWASDGDASEHLLAALNQATRLRLRADVPTGAYLSGGLDSSLVAGIVSRHAQVPPHTFSVAFDTAAYDESEHQRAVADFLGTTHHTVLCRDADIACVMPDVVWHAETPLVRTAPAPLWMLAGGVRRAGLKVVLTGEGADEMFGGYDLFVENQIRRFWARSPHSSWRPRVLERLYPWMHSLHAQPPAYLRAFFQVGLNDIHNPFFSHLPRWRLTGQLAGLLTADVKASLQGHDPIDGLRAALPEDFHLWHPLARAQWLESTILLPGYILSSQGDRMAMAHGVEGRFPFLDADIMAFAETLPAHMKLRGLKGKRILKRAARGLVPQSVIARPKQPYRAPDARRLLITEHGTGSAAIEHVLSPHRVKESGIFDAAAVERLVGKARRGIALSTRDDMALVFVSSTLLLMEAFGAGFETRVESGHRTHPSRDGRMGQLREEA